jgi:serine/threonine protein kinase
MFSQRTESTISSQHSQQHSIFNG